MSEEVAAQETFLVHQSAKAKYQQAFRGRGFDEKAQQERAAERLKKAKKEATAASARRRGIGTGILNALYVARLRVITFSRPGMFAT